MATQQADRKPPMWDIHVTGIERLDPNRAGNDVKIFFTATAAGGVEFKTFVYLSLAEFDEADMISVARNYLHRRLADLAKQTEVWLLDKEWIDAHRLQKR